jgi:UDP-N-acetylmuramoyl-L-alanyl-D-glutamate--2,6-diaminopimelate ligase
MATPRAPAALLADLGVDIRGLTTDSRFAGPERAFLAYPGALRDGRAYISQAIERGAPAILWEPQGFTWNPAWNVPNLAVPDLHMESGRFAAALYGEPSRGLRLVGVTGTNGKTSVTHFIARALVAIGQPATLIGTLGQGEPDALRPSLNTTPDAVLLQEWLAAHRKAGKKLCALEVSSHGLVQGRLNGCQFDTAVFTNLSRDHLDYHGSLEAYAAAKAQLFGWPGLRWAIINRDDPYAGEMAAACAVPVVGYGFDAGEIQARRFSQDATGLRMQIHSDWGREEVVAPLVGRFNAYNLLAALGVLLTGGVAMGTACAALGRVQAPAGRMQMLGGNGRPRVVVDYAHTPDALEKVLITLREAAGRGRVICVFGCGGDRDRGKRPLMGAVASLHADVVIVSSDNPRSEDELAIIEDIKPGLKPGYRIEPDRARAIFDAIGLAEPGDMILIAGKGHEAWQEIAGQKLPFSDAGMAQRALEAWS